MKQILVNPNAFAFGVAIIVILIAYLIAFTIKWASLRKPKKLSTPEEVEQVLRSTPEGIERYEDNKWVLVEASKPAISVPVMIHASAVWHSGPPPHIGWWEASANGIYGNWRWWNGVYWSLATSSTFSLSGVLTAAINKTFHPGWHIKWTYYWPEGARVSRIDPKDSNLL
jgi:hypothetical protein